VTLTGKEFESILIWRAHEFEAPVAKTYTMARCGTIAVFIKGEWVAQPSLPDFNCCLREFGGIEAVFDAKVCSQARYDLSGGTHKSFKHQYRYMRLRDTFGALCFIVLHFNSRVIKTKTEPESTVLFPIMQNEFWNAYDTGECKGVSRREAEMWGIKIAWDIPGNKKTLSPNLYAAICEYAAQRGKIKTIN